jgi:hypothetical protein
MAFYKGEAEGLSNIKGLQEENIDMIISVDSAHLYADFKA